MTRKEQEIINEWVTQNYEKAVAEFDKLNMMWRRLYTRSAYYAVGDNYIYLMSYCTVIAVIDCHTKECFDFLRMVYGYTATSAQHIAKFCKLYNVTRKSTYKPI